MGKPFPSADPIAKLASPSVKHNSDEGSSSVRAALALQEKLYTHPFSNHHKQSRQADG